MLIFIILTLSIALVLLLYVSYTLYKEDASTGDYDEF